jgi:SAM-dependent methyltransferase
MNRLHRWYCQSSHWKHKLSSEILPWSLDAVDLSGEVLELGPGPGLTTDWLRLHCGSLTCLELDRNLARALTERVGDGKVTVKLGDATAMPFSDGLFSVVLSFTMVHHVPSSALQDRVFHETLRVLKPGGIFVGADSVSSFRMHLFHLGDTMVCIDPKRLPARLQAAGFKEVNVQQNGRRFRFRAQRPETPTLRDTTSLL